MCYNPKAGLSGKYAKAVMPERKLSFMNMRRIKQHAKLQHKAIMAELEAKRVLAIKTLKPEAWQFKPVTDLAQFMFWKERWVLKWKRNGVIAIIPLLNHWSFKKPYYYTFIFFKNHRLGIQAIEQNLANDTLPLKTRVFQVNPKKIWSFGSDSAMLFLPDNAEPLDVKEESIGAFSHNPVVYKQNLENTHMSQLLKAHEPAVTNTVLLYVLIAVAVLLLVVLAKQFGWINIG